MRKLVMLGAAGLMIVTASGAGAKPSSSLGPRTVEQPYNYCEGTSSGQCRFGGTAFEVRRGERFVTVELADASGQDVYAALAQDSDPDQDGYEMFHTFCGRTETPVQLIPNVELRVVTGYFEIPPPQCDGAPAVSPTTGTAAATFRK